MPTGFTEHFELLRTLLVKERDEDRKQYLDKIHNRSIEDRRKDGVCWYPVKVDHSGLGLGEKWVLELNRTTHTGQNHLFQAGSSAALFVSGDSTRISATGVISRIKEDSIRLMLNQDDPPEWLDDGKLGLDLMFDESTYDEMEKTLQKLKDVKEGRVADLIRISLGISEPQFENIQKITFQALNNSQNAAVNLVRSARDLALIHGPPGTGKTTTLVQCIIEAIDLEKQVLVCAPSNAAVDLLVEKLHQHGVSIVRLGHPARVTEEVISHTLDVQLTGHADAKMLKGLRRKSEEMIKLAKKYKRKYGRDEARQRRMLFVDARKLKDEARMLEDYMIQDILGNTAVIACTLIGAGNTLLRRLSFKTIFIDEASQGLEPACWVPFMKGNRIVMAGDHLQLPPTIKSNEVSKSILSETIFERCIKLHEHAGTMLSVQYRMHPDIMAFSNNQFYSGNLVASKSIGRRQSLFKDAVEFIDTAGCGFDEEVNPETLSTFNTDEATFVISHLYKFFGSMDRNLSIGVIAPYKAQIYTLKKAMSNYQWDPVIVKNISINSVDAFQGQERDIIYISMTRSNDKAEIGFLSEIRRMNVALTRARYKLVVIGDSATLSSHRFYDEMIVHCQNQGSYHSAFEYSI